MEGGRRKIALVLGTRPDAIKLAPVCKELCRDLDRWQPLIIATAQHREMLDQVLETFGITPDYDLDAMMPIQSPFEVTARVLNGLRPILTGEKPDLVLVQGDTTTAFAAALAAFYLRIPIGHIEAGLRTFDKYQPFPEEKNRQLISVLADLHFAPTEQARQNLLHEGICPDNIYVTGNTVIDALLEIARRDSGQAIAGLEGVCWDTSRVILVTAHRRENWGEPIRRICRAIREIVATVPDVHIVFSVHPNPSVKHLVEEELDGTPNVSLLPPLAYEPFVQLMKRSYLILTDSGGIQEEAPSLGKPVLVLRNVTERPEGVEAGTLRVVGTDRRQIVEQSLSLLTDRKAYDQMTRLANPYGDGLASQRIVAIIQQRFNDGF